ncbi:MAG: FAD-dependent oxidoreductase [Oscillospiraceae bacterium]|nr:FAD-dependent oxidoreductase [Oscillospiraceae bacterium]
MSNIDPRWGSWTKKPDPVPPESIRQELTCDVAVLGAGIAGVTCALRAAQCGLSVIVLEKAAKWSARGGNIGVIGSSFMDSQGYRNDPQAVAREWIARCGNRCDEELVWLYLNRSREAMDWLIGILTQPPYAARPELQACLYRGETYYEIYGSHRFFDGPLAKKGMRPGAADAVYAMVTEAEKLGVHFLYNTPAVELCKEGDRIQAAIGKGPGGYIRIRAAKGVVLATGDIGGSPEMCADLAPLANRCGVNLYTPKGCNTGDGHRLGLWAGGALEDGPFPMILHPQAYFYANYCFLFVDDRGERFMNEDNYIQGKGIAMLRRNMRYAWSILDGKWRQTIPRTIPLGGGIFWDLDHAPDAPGFTPEIGEKMLRQGLQSGLVVTADTPEDLADAMGVPKETFVRTLQQYNACAGAGCDRQFGKRKELLFSLDQPPYYGLKFGPAVLAVVGGLKVGTDMGVRDASGNPVDGLYAIGNAAGGRYGVDYPMLIPGNSHGTALTFGYVLGELLAQG